MAACPCCFPGSGSGSGGGNPTSPTVNSPCCPNYPIEKVLYATISGCSCSGVNGTFPLVYSDTAQRWQGSFSTGCGSCGTLNLQFSCTTGGNSCSYLNMNYNCCGETFPLSPQAGCQCNPFQIVFKFTAVAQGGECCPNQSLTVTITP